MDCGNVDNLFHDKQLLENDSQESLISATDTLDFCTSDDDLLDDASEDFSSMLTCMSQQGESCLGDRLYVSAPITASTSDAHRSHCSIPNLSVMAGSVTEADFRRCTSPQQQIELIFAHLTSTLQAGSKPLTITIKSRRSNPTLSRTADPSSPPLTPSARYRTISFPGKTAKEGWRFSVVIRILELIYEALIEGVSLSKRDIFYRDPALFGSQVYVDRYIDDIAFTLAVSRSALNVTAVAKGLIAGAVTFTRKDGTVLSAASDREGVLVPIVKDLLSADISSVQFIVVIEKEATFRSIAASEIWEDVANHGILLTGKGYPDIATRALLHLLSTPSARNGFASPKVFGLADFDPDGVAILSTYKHGSLALAHEGAELLCPSLQWIGLRSNQIVGLAEGSEDGQVAQGVLKLSQRDRRMATKMLERHLRNNIEMDWRFELQRMLVLGVKAELQLLDAVPYGMTLLLQKSLAER